MLIQFDVTFADRGHNFVGHLGNLLAFLALETVVHQPFAYEFFGELLLGFTFLETLFVAFAVEVAAGVGCMDFVHQIDLAVVFAEFIFRIYQDEATLGSNFCTALEEGQCIFLQQGIFFGSSQTLGQDFLLGDVGVVFTDFGFGRRGDDRFGELLVLLHSFGQTYAADFTHTALVSTPGRAAEVTANNHFYRETFAHYADGYHRVGCSQLPVGADVGRGIEELGGNLVQHLALEGDTFRQDDVEGRDTVGCYHDELFAVDVVHVTYFSVIDTLLSRKVEISFS